MHDFNPRSREGSDSETREERVRRKIFQSTLPRGERRPTTAYYCMPCIFQSTLPRGERHLQIVKADVLVFKFQSTLPRGERRAPRHFVVGSSEFQSTLPRGERQNTTPHLARLMKFQSTLPRGERLRKRKKY